MWSCLVFEGEQHRQTHLSISGSSRLSDTIAWLGCFPQRTLYTVYHFWMRIFSGRTHLCCDHFFRNPNCVVFVALHPHLLTQTVIAHHLNHRRAWVLPFFATQGTPRVERQERALRREGQCPGTDRLTWTCAIGSLQRCLKPAEARSSQ